MRVALVTGAVGAIGHMVCQKLRADGLVVAAVDRSSDNGMLACDVTDQDAVLSCFDQVEAEYGSVSVLVTCAGIMLGGRSRQKIADTPLAMWEETMAVNATGTFLCLREFLSRRQSHKCAHGRAVILSSTAAQLGGYRGSAAYVASKAALLGLVKIAAREAAADGITVNAVAAGPVQSKMFDDAMDPAMIGALTDRIPLGRIGTPGDIAAAVSYLVSEDAGWVTGSTLDVNGGYRMQ